MLTRCREALHEDVLQELHRRHIDWWELSSDAVARRSLRRSRELIFVTSAVVLSCMIPRGEARVKLLTSYRMSD